MILERQPEIEVAERNPATFAAPAHVNDAFFIGQHGAEFRAGLRCALGLEARDEFKPACFDANTVHDRLLEIRLIQIDQDIEQHTSREIGVLRRHRFQRTVADAAVATTNEQHADVG